MAAAVVWPHDPGEAPVQRHVRLGVRGEDEEVGSAGTPADLLLGYRPIIAYKSKRGGARDPILLGREEKCGAPCRRPPGGWRRSLPRGRPGSWTPSASSLLR